MLLRHSVRIQFYPIRLHFSERSACQLIQCNGSYMRLKFNSLFELYIPFHSHSICNGITQSLDPISPRPVLRMHNELLLPLMAYIFPHFLVKLQVILSIARPIISDS